SADMIKIQRFRGKFSEFCLQFSGYDKKFKCFKSRTSYIVSILGSPFNMFQKGDWVKKITSVFYISIILSIIFIFWVLLATNYLIIVSKIIQTSLQVRCGLFNHLLVGIILLFGIYLAFSKYGKIKLGKDNEEPEYSTFSWFAMLFSAGMGIGLVFWGVAEQIGRAHV